MTHRQFKTISSLLVSSFLACSLVISGTAISAEQLTPVECSTSDVSTKKCLRYIEGYLDALKQLNNFGQNRHFSEFEKRAYATRVGNVKLRDVMRKELNLCLPQELSASELLATVDKNQPLKNTLLKALQVKYHCR